MGTYVQEDEDLSYTNGGENTRQMTQMNCFYQRVMARRGKCHTNVTPHDVHPKCLSPILAVNFYLKVVSANQQNWCTNKCNMFDGCGKV